MPSISHEALVRLFRNRPELAPELLRNALHMEIPAYAEIRIEDSDLTQLQPRKLTANAVVLLHNDVPVLVIVLEAQLSRDRDKPYSWFLYLAAAQHRYRCPAIVLVIATSEKVARWASRPQQLRGGYQWAPQVLGPSLVPVVTEQDEAKRDPELAVLSALAHGNDPGVGTQVALAALSAAANLDAQRAALYHDVIFATLGDAARNALEKLMASGYVFQTEFAKKHQAIGRVEGRAEGKAEGRAEDVLRVLEARGLSVSDTQRARIQAATDLELLGQWLVRAVTAPTTEDVFSA